MLNIFLWSTYRPPKIPSCMNTEGGNLFMLADRTLYPYSTSSGWGTPQRFYRRPKGQLTSCLNPQLTRVIYNVGVLHLYLLDAAHGVACVIATPTHDDIPWWYPMIFHETPWWHSGKKLAVQYICNSSFEAKVNWISCRLVPYFLHSDETFSQDMHQLSFKCLMGFYVLISGPFPGILSRNEWNDSANFSLNEMGRGNPNKGACRWNVSNV